MNPRSLQGEDKSLAPVLYMAMELSNRNWKLLLGDGARRCPLPTKGGPTGSILRLDSPVHWRTLSFS
jgi:hypothetical protein